MGFQINILKRDAESQVLLESNAKVLKGWVSGEIAILEKTEGEARSLAHEVARLLRREEQRLDEIVKELEAASTQRRIEALEVELRAIEVRLYEALKELHYQPTSHTPRPVTGSTVHARPTTTVPNSTVRTTSRPVTVAPTTNAPPTTKKA